MKIMTNDNKNIKEANYKRTYSNVGLGEHSVNYYKQQCNINTPNFILFNGNNLLVGETNKYFNL